MNLKHLALYTKNHYERSGDVWEDVKKCLIADEYTPFNKNDILHIVIRNVVPLFKYNDLVYYTIVLVDGISPYDCWKYGYFHKLCSWAKDSDKLPSYDYETAILYFFLSTLQGSTVEELNGLPEADSNVLPLNKIE
jgi:hypothetical protein